MSDDVIDPSLLNVPTGYAYDQQLTEETQRAYTASADLAQFAGATKRMIAEGTKYFNLTAFQADLLRRPNMSGIVTSKRQLLDCGEDGAVLVPISQRSGVCAGVSAGEQMLLTECYAYVMAGGRIPVESLAIWPYLAGRNGLKGDNGSYPAVIARTFHDLGVLPVTTKGKYDFRNMTEYDQETLCIQMRDKPVLFPEWREAAAANGLARVYNPGKDIWSIADCISNGRAVNKGSGYQINVAPGLQSNGVSTLYRLNGGHATCFVGWAIVKGELVFITLESWYSSAKFPAGKYPSGRVLLKTDGGDHLLYPGQGAVRAADFAPVCTDLWALDRPGTR